MTLHRKLTNPSSIAVIGGSDRIDHIGGSVLKNLIDFNFKGQLSVVNPKKRQVQGIPSFDDVMLLPETDLAIIAIPAAETPKIVKDLIDHKGTRGFIIYSAGFGELNPKGADLEKQIVTLIEDAGGSLLGPNNIGIINANYAGIFTRPVPKIDPDGVDFISGSGATAVFTIEAAQQIGLKFSSVITVGNSAQNGIEEILEYLDTSFVPGKSSPIKLLYLETVKNAGKLLHHASSLIHKGCSIIALKSGVTDKGTSAAASHTGAMVNSDLFVQALFDKAGIIRSHSRYEMIHLAAVLQTVKRVPKRFGIITHAGGPAVILTDLLTASEIEVPDLKPRHQKALENYLYPGAACSNPIDILATGSAEQLSRVIEYCENEIDEIEGMIIIFGSPGLGSVRDAYTVIDQANNTCKKPVFAVLPSVINVQNEIESFIKQGNVAFYDESLLGNCLVKIANARIFSGDPRQVESETNSNHVETEAVFPNGYLNPDHVFEILKSAGIAMPKQHIVRKSSDISEVLHELKFPVVQKVIGPLHKSDQKGVIIDVKNSEELIFNFKDLMKIKSANGVLIQEMLIGKEVFIGAKKEHGFPPLLVIGAGGVYIEALQDMQSRLTPVNRDEARNMVDRLRMAPILKGIRGDQSCDMESFYTAIEKVSILLQNRPEIVEMDINPLIINEEGIIAVDARIRIEN